MRTKRKVGPHHDVTVAWIVADLKAVLRACKRVGAKRTADKVRRAIKSAEGAQRHILRLLREQERST